MDRDKTLNLRRDQLIIGLISGLISGALIFLGQVAINMYSRNIVYLIICFILIIGAMIIFLGLAEKAIQKF